MTDAHGVDPNQEIEWIPTMKLGGSRSGNRVVPYIEIRWIPKRKFCMWYRECSKQEADAVKLGPSGRLLQTCDKAPTSPLLIQKY